MGVTYRFTQDQLKVLLSGSGFTSVAGISLNDVPLNNYTVLKTLNGLVSLGVLTTDKDKFKMCSDVKEIISILGSASGYTAIHTASPHLPDLCCYISDKILVCSQDINNNRYISLCLTDYDGLFAELCGQGYLPTLESEVLPAKAEAESFEDNIFAEVSINSPLAQDGAILFSAERSSNTFTQNYMRIVEYYAFNYIVYYNGKEKERRCFSTEESKNILKRMLVDLD